MGLTYTLAQQRDARLARSLLFRFDLADRLLVLTSLVGLIAIALAYTGRSHRVGVFDVAPEAERIVHLNDVADSVALESALEEVLADPNDRRFAARGLFDFLAAGRAAKSPLSSVDALLTATIPTAAIEGTPSLVVYRERLEAARERAQRAGQPAPTSLALLTSADLATLRPRVVVRTQAAFARQAFGRALACTVAFYAVAVLWRLRRVGGDRLLLSAAHLLTALGFAVLLSRPDPLRDGLLFVRYSEGVILGVVLMGLVSLADFRKPAFLRLSYVPLAGALLLSVVMLLFGAGPGSSGAKVNLGPVQPIEAIRLLLALFLAGYFARRWELLRQLGRADHVLPVVAGVVTALGLFFLQKDLGPALGLSCVFLALYAIARGRLAMAMAGVALLVAGFYAGYRFNLSETLAARVAMWASPWDNNVRGGIQVAQAMWALASGGAIGTGLGLGDTRHLPAGHTDLVLAAVGEELGFAGLLSVIVIYAFIAWRGFRIGVAASNDYAFFLATAVTLFLIVPVLLMGAGTLGAIPLTGVVTPFLSYGGSAMTANFTALGILAAIHAHRGSAEAAAPFQVPMAWLQRTLVASGVALVIALSSVQVLRADRYAARPHLGVQGDGVSRYQYNPRLLDLARALPRGNVYDRTGLVLATSDEPLMQKAREVYSKLGIAADPSCANGSTRCYPLGGAAFHLLGDASTRLNWSATNTSFVERDSEDRLRGFDDHAATVRSHDPSGRRTAAMRRDYGELVPLLRNRYQPGDSAVEGFLARDRDLRLTVDARLQRQVAAILANYASRSATGSAAAVVLDPASGSILASVSVPWPARDGLVAGEAAAGALLDRARYGLYPPGSTFKLVTATAALRRNLGLTTQRFTCRELEDGRVGARIPGERAVRDDVLDTRPHGTIAMHEGMVHSCNAYFAQLARRLGPEALLETAMALGIAVSPANSVQRLRTTLPQAGYGQGDVLSSPLRMARVAAAIASDGVLREARVEPAAGTADGEPLLPRAAARVLARYMRDVVLSGTGRSLRDHQWRMAGKTGTAEVAGAASHSWFIGFAPYGTATRRVAFAVIVENAGYGGRTAAQAAGEIVSAAAAAGLVK